MLRSFFIGLSKARWAQNLITHWGFAWRLASRFIAGETPDDALRAIQDLNDRGIFATLDHLGENTTSIEAAAQATQDALEMLDRIQQAELRSGISIKLSQMGLSVDPNLCLQNLLHILQRAQDYHIFVRIDMEDSPTVDKTLRLYWEARRRGFDNVGVVIQSYLYRSESDLEEVLGGGGKIRLVKGAYQEPASLAYPKKADVDRNYDHLAQLMMDQSARRLKSDGTQENGEGRIPPIVALGTHDPLRISNARNYAENIQLPKKFLEFQMLYGIRRDLQEALAAQGYPVRVYVPYGTHWYPYFMRRLAERPANLWFFLSNFFRK